MTAPIETESKAAELRSQAEAKLKRRQSLQPTETKTAVDSQRLLHELQVHQVELEMQNAELHETRDGMESLLEKYTDLYDFAPVSYFTLSAEGKIQLVNLTGTCLVGIERSKLVGQSFVMLISAELRPAFHIFLSRVFEARTYEEGDFELLHQGPKPKFVKIRALRSPDGKQCHTVIVDITERKEAEDKLRVSEIRYRRLFEAAHDGVLLLDPETRKITDANPFMTTLLGYPHVWLVGKELFEIGLLKDEAASQKMFLELKRTHQVRYENLPLESQEGRHQEVEVVANLYQEDGHAVIQCNIRDITERKRAEEAVHRSEALFSALIGQAPVGVYVVDAKFRLQQINAKALPIFSEIHPLMGRDFSEVLHILWSQRIANQIERRFRHTLKTGEPYVSPEFAERRRDSRELEVYEWQLQRVTLPAGEHRVVCFFNNITERKRAEAAQRKLEVLAASNKKLELEIVQRLAVEASLTKSEHEQGQLLIQSRELQKRLRGLSHQILHVQEEERKRISRELHDVIAQSLVGINVHLAALTHEGDGTSKSLQRKIQRTQKIVEKASEAVHHFARELRPTVLDDLGLIPALQSHLKHFTEETGVRVTLTTSAGIEGLIGTRRTALFRIVQEALTNVARHAKATKVAVKIQSLKSGKVRMEVRDDGHGFSVDGFSSAKKSQRLGLLGMKERIEMIGGTFSIDSAPGTSTTVRVEIKADAAKQATAARKKR